MADESIIANLKSEGFKELINDLGLSAKGFSLLDKSIEDAQKKLATLDKTSQEFKDLTKEINAATIAANAYSESSDSLKRELTETNNEIGKLERSLKALEKAGETNTKTYKDLAASQEVLKTKSGELTNTVKSLNAEIKNSGSDTKNLDKALRAVNTVAAGYQAAQGALVLFGGENKKFEQTLLKLNAVMAITQGLQQIQNELSKEDSVFTMAAAKAKLLYATAVGTSTGALRLFRIALLATGIGALVVLVGLLVANWDKLTQAITGSSKALREFNADKQQALKDTAQERTELQTLIKVQMDDNISRENKIILFREQQKLYPELLKNYTDEDFLLGKVNTSIAQQIELLKKRALVNITEKKLADAVAKLEEERSKKTTFLGLPNIKPVQDAQKEVDKYSKRLLELFEVIELQPEVEKTTVAKIKAVKDKNKAVDYKKELELRLRLSKENLAIILTELNEENRLRNKFRLERIKAEEELQRELELQADRTKGLRDKSNDEKIDKEQQERIARQEREKADSKRAVEIAELEKEQKIQIAATTGTEIFNLTRSLFTYEQALLDNKLRTGLISQKEYDKELKELKRKEAIANKAQAAFNITISIAEAIVKATTAGPLIGQILAGITAAFGFAQLAVVLATPLPQFKEGGQVSRKLGLIKGRSHSEGGVPIEVEGDEYVMPVEQTKENLPVLEAIHKGTFHKLFVPKDSIMQPDVFANIPNPANIGMPVAFDRDDYSSINQRLDKLANEMWWLGQYTKEGNRDRNKGTQVLSSKFNFRKSNPNL